MNMQVLKVLRVLAGAGVIAACAPVETTAPRDLSAPISATARYDTSSFAGDWQIVARFGAAPSGQVTVSETVGEDRVRLASAAAPAISGDYRVGLPGELIPQAPGMDRLIVLWVDEDFEAAAIGTVSGSFGAVLDRDGVLPADRARAARDIFEFYGWDVSLLQGMAP